MSDWSKGSLTFTVFGEAAPQGSKRHVGGGRMIESSKRLTPWRDHVRATAQVWLLQHRDFVPFDGAIELQAVFLLPRPKTLPKRVVHATKKPDLDKLLRAIGDALTGTLYTDDSRIVRIVVEKRYAVDQPPQVEITLRERP